MTIKNILQRKKASISFEVFPPKKETAFDSVLTTIAELAQLAPDFVSVTYGAGGTQASNTVAIAAQAQAQAKIPALAHFTCVGSDRQKVHAVLDALAANGIQNVLALRGDWPPNLPREEAVSDFQHASDLVAAIKGYSKQDFCVGGACYPEGHPESGDRERDLDNLKHKVEAGCDFLTTQMFFDNDMLYSFLYRMQSRGIHVPVIAGIMPVTNYAQVSRMIQLSNAYMPRKLLTILDRFKDAPDALKQAGIAYATDQIIDLITNGVRGIHIYTMNKSDVSLAIMRNIRDIVSAVNGCPTV